MREGCRRTALGECYDLVAARMMPADLDPSTQYVGLEHLEKEDRSVAGSAPVRNVCSAVVPFDSGDVLFGRLRPYLRKVALATSPGVCSPEILVLRPRLDVCLPGYLLALAGSEAVIEQCVAASTGSRMPRTNAADLARCEVMVPTYGDQRRIVDLVTHLDDASRALRIEATSARTLR